MENEKLKIFDQNRNQIGVTTREEVHRKGYWHETFHCWFISEEEGEDYLILQLRSKLKKDFPNLFDITAAGHLLADETVQDGVREVEEEIGIDLSFQELVPLGVIEDRIAQENFIDNELVNVFMYRCNITFNEFTLQKEEVSGIVKVKFTDFNALWFGKKVEVRVQGYEITQDGPNWIDRNVGRDAFVPHEIAYYQGVLHLIDEKRSGNRQASTL